MDPQEQRYDGARRRPMTDLGWYMGEVVIGNEETHIPARYNLWDYEWIDLSQGSDGPTPFRPTWWCRPGEGPSYDERVADAIADRLGMELRDRLPAELQDAVTLALRSAALEGYGCGSGEAVARVRSNSDAFRAIEHYALHGKTEEDAELEKVYGPEPGRLNFLSNVYPIRGEGPL